MGNISILFEIQIWVDGIAGQGGESPINFTIDTRFMSHYYPLRLTHSSMITTYHCGRGGIVVVNQIQISVDWEPWARSQNLAVLTESVGRSVSPLWLERHNSPRVRGNWYKRGHFKRLKTKLYACLQPRLII